LFNIKIMPNYFILYNFKYLISLFKSILHVHYNIVIFLIEIFICFLLHNIVPKGDESI
jgi:hypothetical protein